MNKLLCLYYSGVGNTRIVAEFMKKYLEEYKETKIDLYSIESISKKVIYEDYNGIIIGFPTIHCSPATRIIEYLNKVERISRPIPTFVFTTCGLYQANTTRIFSKKCKKKNMITVLDASYRMPAIDGLLLTSKIRFLETCDKRLKMKIQKSCDNFLEIIRESNIKMKMPSFKWYSILNFPNKLVGRFYKFPIYLNKEKCIKCGKCSRQCPAHAFNNVEDYPIWNKKACERCYRCLHHCPVKALSLKKNKPPSRIWKIFNIK